MKNPSPKPGRRITRRSVLKGVAVGGTVAAIPVLFEAEALNVEQHTLRLPNWTAGHVRVAVLSDFHMMEQFQVDRAIRAVHLAMDHKPDFLLLPGDFIEGTSPEELALLRLFLLVVKDLPIPVIATFGNHDAYSNQLFWSIREFDYYKVPILQNEMLDFGGILFVGFEDGIYGNPRPELFGKNEAPRNVVALMHEPGVIDRMPRHYSLQVSGHTHGGQVCLPGGVSLYRPRMCGPYLAGYYPKAPIPLYISRGIGTTGLPFRAFCRPEVTILDLESA